jgi:hypothetical protein
MNDSLSCVFLLEKNMPYIIALIVIVLFIVIALSNGPTNSGALGEQHVGHILGNNQIDKKYVINNLMIVNDGKSCQIDHVLISRTGIFVVETKNYSGRIYGSEDQKEWTQVLSEIQILQSYSPK